MFNLQFIVIVVFCVVANTLQDCNNHCVCDHHLCECTLNNDSKCLESETEEAYAIFLSDEDVISIPIEALTTIDELYINRLNITELQVDLLPITELNYIEFNTCNISIIPQESFMNAENITHLLVKNNQIELYLESGCFDSFENLILLNLANNNILFDDDNIFSGLSNLEVLNLNSNNLDYIPIDLLNGLNNLKEIHLENNKIKSIDDNFFESNTNLEKIYLNINLLDSFNKLIIENLKKLQLLSFSANPLNCNCNMRDLYTEYKKRKLIINAECFRPKINKFTSMKPEEFNCKDTRVKNITETRKNNVITLNCYIESKTKPTAFKWAYTTKLYEKTKYIVPALKEQLKDYILSIDIYILDTQKIYRNYFTCNANGDSLRRQVTYIPSKKNNNNKNKLSKNVIIYEFTSTKDFSLKWNIKMPENTKTLNTIQTLTEVKPSEYIATLKLPVNDFTGKINLEINNGASVRTTKTQDISTNNNNNNNKRMKEISYNFQFKKHKLNFFNPNKLSLNLCVKDVLQNIKDIRDGTKNINYRCFYVAPANYYLASKSKLNRADMITVGTLGGSILIIATATIAYKKMCGKRNDKNDNNVNGNNDNSNEDSLSLSNKPDDDISSLTNKIASNSSNNADYSIIETSTSSNMESEFEQNNSILITKQNISKTLTKISTTTTKEYTY